MVYNSTRYIEFVKEEQVASWKEVGSDKEGTAYFNEKGREVLAEAFGGSPYRYVQYYVVRELEMNGDQVLGNIQIKEKDVVLLMSNGKQICVRGEEDMYFEE